ncbi:MAG: amino acid ABC transporter permease [Solirubrobacteraceae bacterium]|nr:amino acid ABC transporter permease [Solirubrobacteraceae bacterium]
MIAGVDFTPVWEQRGALLSGIGTMALISVVSFALSIVGGLILAGMRRSRSVPIRVAGFVLIQVMRGIALYVLLLWLFFGLAAAGGFQFNPVPAGILALSLLNSAYMAEVFRAGYDAVPPGQKEAALALGLSRWTWFRTVHLPQVVQVSLPAMGNVFVDIVKDTSVLSVVGVTELMRESQRWAQFYDLPFEFYTAAAAIYLAIVLVVTVAWRRLERYSRRHLVHAEATPPRRRLLFGFALPGTR